MIAASPLKTLGVSLLLSILSSATAGCSSARAREAGEATPQASSALAGAVSAASRDPEGETCRARVRSIEGQPGLPGAPAFEANRVEILGRARGEPLVLLREPEPTTDDHLPQALLPSRRAFERARPGARVAALLTRHRRDPRALRALLLREGYAFTTNPLDALTMVTSLKLADLFDEPEIWLERGADRRMLRRETRRGETAYRYIDGPSAGRAADLLFGDRVALRETELVAPLHRDLRALADDLGFDRARVTHRTEATLLADLRFGSRWVRALLEARGPALRLDCIAENAETRTAVATWREGDAPRRRALARVHEVITDQVNAAMRFDRPEGEETADRDGQLRPVWATAYLSGRQSFDFEGQSYPVFDPQGNPWPPQVCVDFVLDTFERASGTWYRPREATPGRTRGQLDFNDAGIPNRRGVIAFGRFSEEQPDLFEVRRFQGEERIPFGDRARFFDFLAARDGEVKMGDVVAIHGLKRDDRIHQHAIFVEWSDPITGFPYGLADQMKRPRRRTWEGIMAEAPKRSLLYRARPTPALLSKVDPG